VVSSLQVFQPKCMNLSNACYMPANFILVFITLITFGEAYKIRISLLSLLRPPATSSSLQLASTVLICGPWPSLMDFSIHNHLVGLLGWGISPTQGLYRHTGQHNPETRRHTSMPQAGFEHWLLRPVFLPFRSIYFPQHPVLKTPSVCVLTLL
jgi:hypothetical protein